MERAGSAARCWPPFSFPATWSPRVAPTPLPQGSTPRATGETPGRCWLTERRLRCSPSSAPPIRLSEPGWSPPHSPPLRRIPGRPPWVREAGQPQGSCGPVTRCRPARSGGITAAGNAGALAGAAVVSATAALLTGNARLLPGGRPIGFLGMLMDSLLGGTMQGTFWCPRCRQPSEWRVHRCGTRTERKSGWVWLNNDGVNLLATALSGGLAWAVWRWLD